MVTINTIPRVLSPEIIQEEGLNYIFVNTRGEGFIYRPRNIMPWRRESSPFIMLAFEN